MADLPIRSFRSPLRVSQMYVHLYTRFLNEFSVDFFFFGQRRIDLSFIKKSQRFSIFGIL